MTGAGNGIGRAVAILCAAEGARVVVADYGVSLDGSDPTSGVADTVVAEITDAGGTAVAVAGDVSDTAVGQRIVATAVEAWGSIDGVACAAGILRERMLFNMSDEEFDDVVRVHLRGHFSLYRAASAVMRKQEGGGRLLGFTSGAFVAFNSFSHNTEHPAGQIVIRSCNQKESVMFFCLPCNILQLFLRCFAASRKFTIVKLKK